MFAHALVEVLNDTEVQEFWSVYQEIQRRVPALGPPPS